MPFFLFFWWGSKAPQKLSKLPRAKRVGSTWFRVVPRPFLPGGSKCPAGQRATGLWKEAEFQAPKEAAGSSLGVALPGKRRQPGVLMGTSGQEELASWVVPRTRGISED